MGLYSTADLIWGIPVESHDENGDPTPFWDESTNDPYGYWREFEGEIEVVPYGHYEDPDSRKGILTTTRVKRYSSDCWRPVVIASDPRELDVGAYNDKAISKSEDQARAAGLDVSFYGEAQWNLVASYG